MLTSNVTRGRDGRHVQVFSNNEMRYEIWEKIDRCNLEACEKWIVLSVVDLMDLTGLCITQIKEVKAIAAKKLCSPIYQANELPIPDIVFSFGSKQLDYAFQNLLKGGSVLELWGKAGSGKTQLALQICSALSPDNHSAYISTEGVVPTSRLLEMCNARGISQANCNIQCCNSVESFTECVMKQLPVLITLKCIKLIVIDSIAAPFRAGEVDGDGIKRAQTIRSIGQQLKYLAHHHSLLVVVLNQATENPSNGLIPALGMTWSYLINSRLMIQKIDHTDNSVGLRRITVQKASCIKLGKYVDCTIQKDGVI